MASGWTNAGKNAAMRIALAAQTAPTTMYLALVTSATAPTADTNTKGELTEIVNGNGYTTGGIALARNGTNFNFIEVDASDWAEADIPDQVWTAAGGPLPASAGAARWAILTDDNATQASRVVWAWFDLVADRSVSVGQTLTLQNMLLRAA